MNLADGRIISQAECDALLDTLDIRLLQTLSKPRLPVETVLNACDRLEQTRLGADLPAILAELGIPDALARDSLRDMKRLFSRTALETRLKAELGGLGTDWYTPPAGGVRERILPLGVLLHIAAGNADGLPAFSVLEGLLCGNINLLKLPAGETVSVRILQALVEAEPSLAEYVYVFDYTSQDQEAIARLVRLADGVAVWGGDEAVSALRRLAGPDTRLIEWGHRLSFAYATKTATDAALLRLARGICRTDQLLCSSCQGIFLDTDRWEDVCAFCQRFLPLLEQASAELPAQRSLSLQARITLQTYSAVLDQAAGGTRRVYRGEGCSVTACPEPSLEASIQFRNCWAAPLPRRALMKTLRPHKGYLQTAALLCGEEELSELSELLLRAGVNRITRGDNMSSGYCGAPHDGEFPLRRYSRVVSLEL